MESEVVLPKRRGRKRRRKDVEDDEKSKKLAVGTRSKVLLGRYVKKEFEGSGVFLGKIAYYDTGLYRVDYEDGDCEDLESGEVKQFLVEDCDMDDEFLSKKEKLDDLVSRKYAKAEVVTVENAVELETLSNGGTSEINGAQLEGDADSSSDSCEYVQDCDLSSEVEAPHVPPPPELPCSSGNIGVPEDHVSHLFSVYSFLRSFSIRLFLSPFGLDEFVGALNCSVPNTLLDAIHVALMRALRSHFEALSSDGSELASKCLRCMDWSLLDTLTWPVFLVQYLLIMSYTEGLEWKGFYVDALHKDYYTLSAGRKLVILQILCDDVLDSAELRAEVDMREESEVGSDSDGVAVFSAESGPRRVHPRYSKTSACKGQEAMEIISESHLTKSSSNSRSLDLKSTGLNLDEDGNGDECRLCGMDGTLLCCDGCPSAYHSRCIGVIKMFIPAGTWYCPECKVNEIGPKITRTTSLRGAEIFGVDLYEQVFLGTCDHLLVLKVSRISEPSIRYYNQNDIHGLLKALNSSVEHVAMYMEICKGILHYWEIPEDVLSLTESVGLDSKLLNEKEDTECHTQPTPSGKEYCNAQDIVEGENIASGVTESTSEDVDVSCLGNRCKETGFNKISLDNVKESDHHGQQTMESGSRLRNCKPTAEIKVETAISAGSVSVQPDPSELTQQSLGGKSSVMEYATCNSGNSICVAPKMSSKSKQVNYLGRSGCGNAFDGCLYMGSSFRSQAYLNHYTHGDFAASAAANLAILSTEENRVSESHASSNHRKIMSANFSLQIKAFSSAAKRFFWPHYEKKLVEVPRERCGWCLSCKAAISSKRGCLLNAAASNAIKGAMKILAGIRPVKSGEGCLAGIATYVMFMEESLCGLTVGPFVSSTCRKQWRKEVEQAATLSAIKTLLLELEENIRMVAFCTDWVKLVDDIAVESSAVQSAASAVGSAQRRGPGGRRGRKLSSSSEVTDDDGQDTSKGFVWWRGGMLSKHLFQRGALPQSMVKKAACQGGSRKIPGIHYADGFEVPRRSRQFVWRAAVEMSKNASQLALQVRYLDLHVRWSDLVCPEQSLPDGKGPDTEVSAFRNAFVIDKRTVENKISYAVAFENQKHLPSRVMKNILDTEQTEDGKEKIWFSESRIPLYLIKEYEEMEDKVVLPSDDKCVHTLSKLQRRQLKASRKNIFTYLSRKRETLETCCCTSCQTDLLIGNAVKCSRCQGYCHERCIMSKPVRMNEELSGTCKECYLATCTIQTEKISESPTSPLPLQGQELRRELTVSKSKKQNGYKRPLASIVTLQQSSQTKATSNDSSSAKNKQRKLSLGLIWKKNKKDTPDIGIDFRLKNILLKDNPDRHSLAPECNLCGKPYDSNLMYICCETCKKWYHADAVELEESRIFQLAGFKCCRCRRIRSPVCPYTDPETRAALEAKRPRIRAPKQANQGGDPDSETICEQVKDGNSGSTSILPVNEEVVNVLEEDPLLFSHPVVEQVDEQKPELDFERNAATVSEGVPQKLPVRRNVKSEKEICPSENIPSPFESSTPYAGNILNLTEESSAPHVEWDVSMDGFEGDLMFDYEGLNYEDMEFEPQTYFSFTELLAPEDGIQSDGVDPSGDVMGNWEEASTPLQDCNPEKYQMDITYDQQEPTFSLEGAAVDTMSCGVCSLADPYPDLSCQICGLRMHCYCSPWNEESSWEGGWRCGNCREWR